MEQPRGSALIRVGAFVLTVLLVAGAVVFFLGRVHRAAASADTAAPDPGRLVDVTVRLGRDFAAAPAGPAVLDRQP